MPVNTDKSRHCGKCPFFERTNNGVGTPARPKSKIQGPKFEGEHPTSNIQHPTSNIEHSTSNIEHRTSNRGFWLVRERFRAPEVGAHTELALRYLYPKDSREIRGKRPCCRQRCSCKVLSN